MATSWNFAANDGEIEGFNATGISIFAGQIIDSVVREAIQNSLDARLDVAEPAVFAIDLIEVPKADARLILSAEDYFIAAEKMEKKIAPASKEGAEFYRQARETLKNKSTLRFLALQDFNTTGLTGITSLPDDDDEYELAEFGPWLSLVKGAGITKKTSADALGSYGQGAKAPFALSKLRMVAYLTRINKGKEQFEDRFQGKSILQTMKTDDGVRRGKTGYFGAPNLEPLRDKEVPSWAIQARLRHSTGTGTSVLVAEPNLVGSSSTTWLRLKVAVLANFYFAISSKNLVVRLNEEEIRADNVHAVFDDLIGSPDFANLDLPQQTQDAFESAKTINQAVKNPDMHGTSTSKDFDEFKWFIRLGENVSRRTVGIARQNGMLITRSAEKLVQFNGLKPFDLFICVTGKTGSEILRRFENPEHNTFQFDRVVNEEDKNELIRKYKNFALEVRNLLSELAAPEIIQEAFTDDLNHLFGSNDFDEEGTNTDESSRRVVISKPKKISVVAGEKVATDEKATGKGSGFQGGNGDKSTKGGTSPNPDGEKDISVTKFVGRQVKNLRVSPPDSSGMSAIHFTPSQSGNGTLCIYKSGETDKEKVTLILPNGKKVDEINLASLNSKVRKTLRVGLDADLSTFSFEAVIHYDN